MLTREIFKSGLTLINNSEILLSLNVFNLYSGSMLTFSNLSKTSSFPYKRYLKVLRILTTSLFFVNSFSNRLSRVYFSASNDIPNYYRWGRSFFTGSHPLVDSNFSSSNMAIQLSGTSLSRFDKTKIISDWDVVLDHLRVCNLSNKYTAEFLNCGECEKCLRTMLGLHAVGALERSNAFAVKDVSNEKIRTNATLSKYTFQFYEELLGPLSEAGYHDLVKIIKNKLIKKKVVLRTIEPIKELDKKFTGGSLVRLKRLVSKKGISY